VKKEVILMVGQKVAVAVSNVIEFAVVSGGLFITMSALDKRFNRRNVKHAANLACLHGLKEGEIQEIIRVDGGVPFIQKSFIIDVPMYIVESIKADGQYKMRYIGTRTVTKEEAEDVLTD